MHLDEVLHRLEQAGLKLKPSKCQILQSEVVFLGHVVSQVGIHPNPKSVKLPSFSDIAAPLTELTRKDAGFSWSGTAKTAFQKLKDALLSAPILVFHRDEGDFVLDTDASAIGIGAVLQQVQDGEEKVVAYG